MAVPVKSERSRKSRDELMEEEGESAREDLPDVDKDKTDPLKASRPQVWIKLRPSADAEDTLFKIGEDGKGIRLLPDNTIDRSVARISRPQQQQQQFRREREDRSGGRIFSCDGVLRNQSQEETYQMIAHELVGKAMEGTSGIIVSIGPESSGKFYSLFGSISKFQYRGIIPRCLERIFQICESKAKDFRYLIRMAIVEIRHDKIRDLLTLGTFQAAQFEKEAQGMIFQKIASADHGVGLLIRALTCQKEIPRENYAKPHTVVFVDIYGESQEQDGEPEAELRVIKSRITFAKTAAIPERDVLFPPPVRQDTDAYGCATVTKMTSKVSNRVSVTQLACSRTDMSPACNKLGCSKSRAGPIAEAIRIRQDIGFLEQMCSRACEYQKLAEDYEKLVRRGVEPPLPPRAQHYRLSKLTYCLKEIVSGNSEIRIILHIRPERKYKHATLEAMRFADKVKIVPNGVTTAEVQTKDNENTSIFSDDFNLIDFLNKMPPEVTDLYIQVNPGTFSNPRDHAAALIDSRVHAVEDTAEEGFREMFEQFRAIWIYLTETGTLPLSVQGSDKKESQDTADDGTDSWTRKLSRMIAEQRKSGIAVDESFSKDEVGGIKSSRSETRIGGKKPKAARSKYNSARERKKKKAKVNKAMDSFSKESHSPELSSGEREGEQEMDSLEMPEEQQLIGEDQLEGLPSETEQELKLPESEIPSKDEAWREFLGSESGSAKQASLTEKNESLRKIATTHNDAIRESGAIISRLNNLQTELNLIQQERFLQGAQYDANGEIIVSPHEKQIIHEIKNLENSRGGLAFKMNGIRSQLFALKKERDDLQMALNSDFEAYSVKTYGVSYGESEAGQKPTELDAVKGASPQPDQDKIKKYEDIRRVARKQARLFLRAIVKKPSWVPY